MGIFFPFPGKNSAVINDWNSENISQEEEIIIEPVDMNIGDSNYEKNKRTEKPKVSNFTLDLDYNGKNERVVVKSYPGIPGDQNTEIYINSSSKPILTEIGSFYAIKTHKMDNSNQHITELQLQTGQSFNTLFYIYQKGKLERISVSTEKPPSWYGIISRNSPEFEDINSDGTLELLAYYNFLYDATRKVEVYTFNGKAFNKIQEYEEARMPEIKQYRL